MGCSGLGGIDGGDVCCVEKCGSCGGSGCGNRPGGAKRCCRSNILSSGQSCRGGPAPCIIHPDDRSDIDPIISLFMGILIILLIAICIVFCVKNLKYFFCNKKRKTRRYNKVETVSDNEQTEEEELPLQEEISFQA